MQLFILDHDPGRVPAMLCDAHVRKMCLETAQILSSVIRRQGKKLPLEVPKPYNPNHPVITALDTAQKINWTVRFNTALQREYCRRFGKKHAYSGLTGIYQAVLFRPGTPIDPAGWTFARDFKDVKPEFRRANGRYRFRSHLKRCAGRVCFSDRRIRRDSRYDRRCL